MKNILFAVSGLTPQIVTETLYYYAVLKEPAVVFSEVRILTTRRGKELIVEKLLGSGGAFAALCRDHRLSGIRFDESTIQVFGGDEPLDDIRNSRDSGRVAEEITRCIGVWTADPDSALYCSIAGGRKTMGVYLALALQLYGRTQDRLSHVLVNDAFESVPDFYYPPLQAATLKRRDGSTISTAQAIIDLAEIPFVSLRKVVNRSDSLQLDELVRFAQDNVDYCQSAPAVEVDLEKKTLTVGGRPVVLKDQQLACYALFLNQKLVCGKEVCDQCENCWFTNLELAEPPQQALFFAYYGRVKGGGSLLLDGKSAGIKWDKVAELVARINKALTAQLDPFLIHHLKIRSVPKQGENRKKYGILLDKRHIRINGA